MLNLVLRLLYGIWFLGSASRTTRGCSKWGECPARGCSKCGQCANAATTSFTKCGRIRTSSCAYTTFPKHNSSTKLLHSPIQTEEEQIDRSQKTQTLKNLSRLLWKRKTLDVVFAIMAIAARQCFLLLIL